MQHNLFLAILDLYYKLYLSLNFGCIEMAEHAKENAIIVMIY